MGLWLSIKWVLKLRFRDEQNNGKREYVVVIGIWYTCTALRYRKGRRNVQGEPQSRPSVFPRHQEEEEIDNTKQGQIEQTYEKH